MLEKVKAMLEMIKFGHTIFALPFALIGAFLAKRGVPDGATFGWIILAMVGARTAAMGFNRIADRKFDAANPRTADRALSVGTVRLGEAWALVILFTLLYFVACAQLNSLTLKLSPFALGLTFIYSLTKRFTWLCHVVLGVALAFSPLGGWVAVRGTLHDFPLVLSMGVLFWVAGFDTVYACLDADFDRQAGLHSLPSRFGREKAFSLAFFFHGLAFLLFTLTGIISELNFYYYLGVAFTACALFYQHFVVSPKNMSQIQLSFFTMNGLISLALFVATWLSLVVW
ncbi:MAG TPA: 4-hydroxybenzoate octaprenyltransferase [Desulfobulbaceae bacterium]|nr:MAG: 4-hydroxybenzoate octaprenyltransferase [Deltaproteobacteria bacterium RIFOXYD12_FULL_53_23]HCC54941.1 4-hydroxybenzoate octaprenyltransferase [Desulfobulbaceae bacterium]